MKPTTARRAAPAAVLGLLLSGSVVSTGAVAAAVPAPAATISARTPAGAGAAGAASSKPRPEPRARPSKADVLKRNRLYRAPAMPAVGCAPAAQGPLDTSANLEAYHRSVLTCLDAAWAAVWPKKLRKAGSRFEAPRLRMHSGNTSSPCGPVPPLSFYCPPNRTIYMYAPEITGPWAEFPNPYSAGLIRLSATHTLAHEYGHHVQQLSGIFAAIARRYSGSREERAELQASCLGNVFLSSQRAAYPILEDYGQRPESWRYIQVPNHGSVANQQVWTDRGYLGARPGDCNTFKASRAATS